MYTTTETIKAIAFTVLAMLLVIALTGVALATLPINPWFVFFGAFGATMGALAIAAECA